MPTKSKRENEEWAEIDREIERENDEMRTTYLKTTNLYTAEDIRALNPSASSSKWKREGRVFAIQDGEKDLFPAFQFADGEPLPIIKKILKALPEDMSPWETAFWFESSDGWLAEKPHKNTSKMKARSLTPPSN